MRSRPACILRYTVITERILPESTGAEDKSDPEWTDGAVLLLTLGDEGMEIAAHAVSAKKWIARGHYRFAAERAD